ncbi:unnamed protein product [Sphenostylis stenocarpa]|uniref:Uncharacterized protein n=1 Tax=Sphenostylis stenocarpa TaxID=92480 RepID=A0AA86SC20_9FABA|nr:unnamed protein product [Sphenostylis stenocarpa]
MASADETERSVAKKLRHVGRKLLKGSSLHKLLQLLHVTLHQRTMSQDFPSNPYEILATNSDCNTPPVQIPEP